MPEQVTEEITLHLGDEKTRTIRLIPEQEVGSAVTEDDGPSGSDPIPGEEKISRPSRAKHHRLTNDAIR
jgi:hypothetical protein